MGKREIFDQIRQSLNRKGPLPPGVAEGLNSRLASHPRHVQPAFDEDPVERFLSRVTRVAGTFDRCTSSAQIAQAVRDYLEAHQLPPEIITTEDEWMMQVPWSNALGVRRGVPDNNDRVSVTATFAGVAETGSVVLLSSRETPTTLNFLPEFHIAVVRRSKIVRHTEDVWSALRERGEGMPRTVNFVTGPSRTGDVEQVLQLGAHGPRELHVLLLED